MPKLNDCQLHSLLNAPDNFTPDGKWILGETPEIDNYFVAVIGSYLLVAIDSYLVDNCFVDYYKVFDTVDFVGYYFLKIG